MSMRRVLPIFACLLCAPAACAPVPAPEPAAAPAPAPPPPPPGQSYPYPGEWGPEQSFTGTLVLSFERQSLDYCWLDFTGTAAQDLERLAPSPNMHRETARYSAEVTLVGRRRQMVPAPGNPPPPMGFGHLSQYPCLIEARQITAARLLEP